MELPRQFDNITQRVIDDLKVTLRQGSRVSMAAASFSIYAFEALQKELEKVDALRFIFISGFGEHKAGALSEIVETKKRIIAMEAELQSLEKRMRKKPQYDVQVKMNKQVKAKRRELAGLKQKMEELSV